MSIIPKEYMLLTKIALGSVGRIFLAKNKVSGKPFAIKMINKETLETKGKHFRANSESAILKELKESSNPFLVKCFETFSTNQSLYLVLEYLGGGDMFTLLNIEHHISHEQTKLYAAELILAVIELHRRQIIHKDLKPENIMLRFNGHIVLTDFGHSEKLITLSKKTSFGGTKDFRPPEFYLQNHYGYEGDWFQVGVVIYEMYCGENPFLAEKLKSETILTENLKFYYGHTVPDIAQDFIKKLLKSEPSERLGFGTGNNDIIFPVSLPLPKTTPYKIMSDEYFKDTDWNMVYNLEYDPIYVPKNNNSFDSRHFDIATANIEDPFLEEDKNHFSSCYNYPDFDWC